MDGADRDTPAADECRTMTEVRAAIDALDRRIVVLLAERMRYIEAAARLKGERSAVRDEDRKAEVIGNAVAAAGEQGFPPELAASIWEALVEGSIAHELERFDRLADAGRKR